MWDFYVTNICTKTWGLQKREADEVVRRIQDLAANGHPSDAALEVVLMEAGVDPSQAVRVAPTIRAAISPR